MRNIDRILADEDARRLRLRVILLEDDIDELNEQLVHEDERMEVLEQERDALQHQVDQYDVDARRSENEIRVRGRELNNLKVGHIQAMAEHALMQ